MPNRRRDGKKLKPKSKFNIKFDLEDEEDENESIIKLSKTRLLEIMDLEYKLKPEIIIGLKAMGRKQLLEVYTSIVADNGKIQDKVNLPGNVLLPKEQNMGKSKRVIPSFRRKADTKLTKKIKS